MLDIFMCKQFSRCGCGSRRVDVQGSGQ